MSHGIRLWGIACAVGILGVTSTARAKGGFPPGYPYQWPGLYEGTGKLTGGFDAKGVKVQITSGGAFKFCAHIGSKTPHLGVIRSAYSHWALEPTTVSAVLTNGAGMADGTIDGFGTLGGYVNGTGSGLVLYQDGTDHLALSLDIFGLMYKLPTMDVAMAGQLPAKKTSSGFKGDGAVQNRKVQQQNGFTSNERLNYTAHRVKTCVTSTPPTIG
jgi:hypothetical protein